MSLNCQGCSKELAISNKRKVRRTNCAKSTESQAQYDLLVDFYRSYGCLFVKSMHEYCILR